MDSSFLGFLFGMVSLGVVLGSLFGALSVMVFGAFLGSLFRLRKRKASQKDVNIAISLLEAQMQNCPDSDKQSLTSSIQYLKTIDDPEQMKNVA